MSISQTRFQIYLHILKLSKTYKFYNLTSKSKHNYKENFMFTINLLSNTLSPNPNQPNPTFNPIKHNLICTFNHSFKHTFDNIFFLNCTLTHTFPTSLSHTLSQRHSHTRFPHVTLTYTFLMNLYFQTSKQVLKIFTLLMIYIRHFKNTCNRL